MQRLDGAVGLGAAGADPGRASAEQLDRLLKAAAKLAAVIGERPLEPPAGSAELFDDAPGEFRGLGCARLAVLAADQLGPGIRAADVDRG